MFLCSTCTLCTLLGHFTRSFYQHDEVKLHYPWPKRFQIFLTGEVVKTSQGSSSCPYCHRLKYNPMWCPSAAWRHGAPLQLRGAVPLCSLEARCPSAASRCGAPLQLGGAVPSAAYLVAIFAGILTDFIVLRLNLK